MQTRTAFSVFVFTLGAGLAALPLAAAEVYKWVDEQGVVHFTDQPPENRDSTEVAIQPPQQTVSPQPGTTGAAPAWYDQWLAEQQERKRLDQAQRQQKTAERGAQQAHMLETCAEARQRLKVLETACPAFFDGRGVLRNWCPHQATWAYQGEFRYLEDDERSNMIKHYREQLEECEAAGY